MPKLDIIATINTHKADGALLDGLVRAGATIFRINGAHMRPAQIPTAVKVIRQCCGDRVKVLIDLPGNKIRTRDLVQTVTLKRGESFALDSVNFSLESFPKYLKRGDTVISSDGQLTMSVKEVAPERVIFLAECDGELLNNKGLHVPTAELGELPFLWELDRKIIEHSLSSGVDYAGFSFVRTPANIEEAKRALAGSSITPIFKLETKEATAPQALQSILSRAEIFAIDRGDLASEVGMASFPATFNRTLSAGLAAGKKMFVATQLFASMYERQLPFLSEVVEFHRLAHSGIAGIQLSEETAIGKHPFEVLAMIATLSSAPK